MSIFILIHGSWHGGWNWYKIKSQLQKNGHIVMAPDLLGMGVDKTPIADISLERWTEQICQIIDEQKEKVTLVGHSRGGIIISQVAEKRPKRINNLIYVSAFLLSDGTTLGSRVQSFTDDLIGPNIVINEEQGYYTVPWDVMKVALYGDCPDDDIALSQNLLVPEPLEPLMATLSLSEEGFGKIPRHYIECCNDKAIPLAEQRKMYDELACQNVISMDCGHSPFFSKPDELTSNILKLVQ